MTTHYERNKEKYKATSKVTNAIRRAKNKQEVRQYLEAHACVDCGITDVRVLQFDHRDRAAKSSTISKLLTSTKKLWEEINKCDVRCANCHMIRTSEQFGWLR